MKAYALEGWMDQVAIDCQHEMLDLALENSREKEEFTKIEETVTELRKRIPATPRWVKYRIATEQGILDSVIKALQREGLIGNKRFRIVEVEIPEARKVGGSYMVLRVVKEVGV